MKFKLKSNFAPTGDQPQAIELLTTGVLNSTPHQTLLGVTGSGKTFTLANVIEKVQKPTLVISHNKTLAAQLYQEFRDFFPDNAVNYFVSYYDYYQPESYLPATDTYIEKETDINDEIDKLRLSATTNLLSRPDCIVVASVSCIYNLGSPLDYAKNILELVQGQIISRTAIMSRLVDMQYARNDYQIKRGHFQVRGDTLFIWPANADTIVELIFLDDRIESVRNFEPQSGDTTENPAKITLYPAKHYQSGQDKADGYAAIEHDLKLRLVELKKQGKVIEAYRLSQRVQHDIDMMREVGFVNGIENYSRYFDGRKPGDPPFTLLDYFAYNAKQFHNDDYLTIIDESHITLPQLRGMYAGDQSRKKTLIDYGFRLPSALDNRPLQYPETKARLPQIIYASATPNQEELDLSQPNVAEQLIRPTGLIDPHIDIRPSKGQVADLLTEIKRKTADGQRVLVTTLTKKTAEALTEYLSDQTIKVQYLHADVHTLDRSDILDDLRAGEYDVLVGINLLREGLDLPEVGLVAIIEADKEGFLRSKSSLIQVMGRAARHVDGQVIMYADTVTKSMKAAIDEVERRRKIQLQYNKQHHITPQTIQKAIREKLLLRTPDEPKDAAAPKELKKYGWKKLSDINPNTLTPKDTKTMIKELTKLMKLAAKNWDFELAAKYRDMVKRLH